MPAILIKILSAFAAGLVAKMLLGAGLAIFTYSFVDDIVIQAQNEMRGLMNNLPSDVIGLVSILKIPQGLSVIMSAMGIAAFIKMSKVYLGKAG